MHMTTNNTNRPLSHSERLARYSNAAPAITMNDRPADRTRNGQRAPRSVKHKGMR